MLASAQHPKPLAYCIHQAQKYQNAYETHLSAWYMHFMACRMPFSSIIFMWIGLNRMAPFRGKKLCLSHLGTPGMAASPFAVLHHTPQGTSAETCRCDAIIWHYMTLLIDIIILYAYMTYMAWLMHDIALVVNTFRPFQVLDLFAPFAAEIWTRHVSPRAKRSSLIAEGMPHSQDTSW